MLENLVFGSPIEGTPPSTYHIRAVLHNYCKCLSEGDVDGILNLFDPEAHFFDPVGEPHVRRTRHCGQALRHASRRALPPG
mgnify:CR=1 FL=1